jgi:hypothetical protein
MSGGEGGGGRLVQKGLGSVGKFWGDKEREPAACLEIIGIAHVVLETPA